MKTFVYGLAAGLTAAMLMAAPASASPARPLDQYGCRWESADQYHCYRGAMSGRSFESRQHMLRVRMAAEPMTLVYVDDDGAPRPLSPRAARGKELPSADTDDWYLPAWR